MKKNFLERIKLNKLSVDELEQRRMNALKGGCECKYRCGCVCPEEEDGPLTAASKSYSLEYNPIYVFMY